MTPTRRKDQLTPHQMPVPRSSDALWGRARPAAILTPASPPRVTSSPALDPAVSPEDGTGTSSPHPPPPHPRLRREVAGPRQTVWASLCQVPLVVGASRGASAPSGTASAERYGPAALCGSRERLPVVFVLGVSSLRRGEAGTQACPLATTGCVTRSHVLA